MKTRTHLVRLVGTACMMPVLFSGTSPSPSILTAPAPVELPSPHDSAAVPPPGRAAQQYELSLVRTYGWGSLADSVTTLTAVERQYGGGVLGSRVVGLALASTGHVYVLDWDYQKIVEFDSEGAYRRIILGGYGEGPGEFIRPRDLAISPTGLLAVLDAGLGRVSLFDPQEGFQDSFALDFAATDIMFTEHGLLVKRWYRAEGFGGVLYSLDGVHLGETLLVSAREAEDFAFFGETGRLGSTPHGVLFASPVIGHWRSFDDAPLESRGVDLFPRLKGQRLMEPSGMEFRFVQGTTKAIGLTSADEVVIIYEVNEPEPNTDELEELGEPGYWIARFDRAGNHQGSSRLFDSDVFRSRFTLSPYTGNLFMFELEPFPHIVEYEFKLTSS